MKTNLLLHSCLGLLLASPIPAQDDPVQEAIRKFESSRKKKPAEVTVVLDPPPPSDTSPASDPTPDTQAPPAPADSPAPPAPPPPSPPKHEEPVGISVAVRNLESPERRSDASTPKILAPFPAKPLSQPPPGWLIESSDNIAPYTREVELSPGNTITLKVKPHVLVPDADGYNSFIVPEPGYNPALEYRQNATIGAVLAGSLRQLDADSKQLGLAIDQLQQLLISLPKPKATPVPDGTESPPPEP